MNKLRTVVYIQFTLKIINNYFSDSLSYFEMSKHLPENTYQLIGDFTVEIVRKYL